MSQTQAQPKINTTDVIRAIATVSARAVADVEAELARAPHTATETRDCSIMLRRIGDRYHEASRRLMRQLLAAVLQAAADLVRQGWTQREDARDRAGRPCRCDGPDAVSWSLEGAIERAWRDHGLPYYLDTSIVRVVAETLSGRRPIDMDAGLRAMRRWNDAKRRTQEEVVALLERAANRALYAPEWEEV